MESCSQPRGLFSTRMSYGYLFPVSLALLGWLAFRWDVQIVAQVHGWRGTNPEWFDTLKHICDLSEAFAHGQGVFMILVGIFFIDHLHRRCVLRIAVCAVFSGGLAVLIKSLIVRVRPLVFLPTYLDGGSGSTFGEWFPLLSTDMSSYEFQSFPSGHTSTAVGLAIGLAWRYPQARWYFISLALLASCQRLFAGAHYVSDLFFGAAIGSAVGLICVGSGSVGLFLTRFEQSGKKVLPGIFRGRTPVGSPSHDRPIEV